MTRYLQHALYLNVFVDFLCVWYLVYLISDTRQDKEKDKHEAEYMLRENSKAMYE